MGSAFEAGSVFVVDPSATLVAKEDFHRSNGRVEHLLGRTERLVNATVITASLCPVFVKKP